MKYVSTSAKLRLVLSVRPSRETGWLEGVLNGKRGLIPENYIQYLNN